MVVVLKSGTVEARIVSLLLDRYPLTVEEIGRDLRLGEDMLQREIARLVSKGYVQLEPLPDKTYVRLLRLDFSFVGRNETQKRSLKHKPGKKSRGGSSPGDHMYG